MHLDCQQRGEVMNPVSVGLRWLGSYEGLTSSTSTTYRYADQNALMHSHVHVIVSSYIIPVSES